MLCITIRDEKWPSFGFIRRSDGTTARVCVTLEGIVSSLMMVLLFLHAGAKDVLEREREGPRLSVIVCVRTSRREFITNIYVATHWTTCGGLTTPNGHESAFSFSAGHPEHVAPD